MLQDGRICPKIFFTVDDHFHHFPDLYVSLHSDINYGQKLDMVTVEA